MTERINELPRALNSALAVHWRLQAVSSKGCCFCVVHSLTELSFQIMTAGVGKRSPARCHKEGEERRAAARVGTCSTPKTGGICNMFPKVNSSFKKWEGLVIHILQERPQAALQVTPAALLGGQGSIWDRTAQFYSLNILYTVKVQGTAPKERKRRHDGA